MSREVICATTVNTTASTAATSSVWSGTLLWTTTHAESATVNSLPMVTLPASAFQVSVPCRHHTQTQYTIIETFLDHFDALLGQPTNRLGRCPFAHCRREIVASVSKLSDCSSDATVRSLANHMKLSHGMGMSVSSCSEQIWISYTFCPL
jgi:hypothetical protein